MKKPAHSRRKPALWGGAAAAALLLFGWVAWGPGGAGAPADGAVPAAGSSPRPGEPSGGSPPPVPPPARPAGGKRSYFAHARFEAVRDAQGQPAGVRVVSVARGGRVWRLGLKPGDLMLGINGVSLHHPASFSRAVETAEHLFLTADRVRVKLRRGTEVFALVELGPVKRENISGSPSSGSGEPPRP
ncbi:MAG: hypothetical protein ACE5HD_03475 [Acidobacteriota bacterium]